jgi:hypothetical protein
MTYLLQKAMSFGMNGMKLAMINPLKALANAGL